MQIKNNRENEIYEMNPANFTEYEEEYENEYFR